MLGCDVEAELCRDWGDTLAWIEQTSEGHTQML
jgi:hypothetical protein